MFVDLVTIDLLPRVTLSVWLEGEMRVTKWASFHFLLIFVIAFRFSYRLFLTNYRGCCACVCLLWQIRMESLLRCLLPIFPSSLLRVLSIASSLVSKEIKRLRMKHSFVPPFPKISLQVSSITSNIYVMFWSHWSMIACTTFLFRLETPTVVVG